MRLLRWRWHRNGCILLTVLMLAVLLIAVMCSNKSHPHKYVQKKKKLVQTFVKRVPSRSVERNLHQEPPDADAPLLPFADDGGQGNEYLNPAQPQLLAPSVPGKPSSSPKSPQPPVQQSLQQMHCKQPHCAEFLSRLDKVRQSTCLQEVLKSHRGVDPTEVKSKILESNCRFMEAKGRSPVALASAEGSGNTWVRGLLEKASGVCTGFNFCDYMMRMKGFIGENINSGSVLVVKTHTDHPQWLDNNRTFNKFEARYGSGIFLLRNPYHSLVAEWNRRLTNQVMIKQKMPHNESHTNIAPREIWCEYIFHTHTHTSCQIK